MPSCSHFLLTGWLSWSLCFDKNRLSSVVATDVSPSSLQQQQREEEVGRVMTVETAKTDGNCPYESVEETSTMIDADGQDELCRIDQKQDISDHSHTKTTPFNDDVDDVDYDIDSNNNDHEPVLLPTLEYGYRTTRMDWDELTDIIENGYVAKLTRSRQQQTEYEMYKRNLSRVWNSMLDHVLHSKFGFAKKQRKVTDTQWRYVAHPSLEEWKQQQEPGITKTVLVRNDFPYYTATNVEHWVLWKLGASAPHTESQRILQDKDIVAAKQQLQTDPSYTRGKVLDCLHWINPTHLMSLPELDHAHILCLVDRRGNDRDHDEDKEIPTRDSTGS